MLTWIILLIALLSLSYFFIRASFHSHVLKIAFRNIFRIKRESFLMVLGSMIGTTFIIGSLGMNDSFKNYIYKSVDLYFGEIDEVINSKISINYSKIEPFINELKEKDLIDGVIPIFFKLYPVTKKGNIRGLKVSEISQASIVGMDYHLILDFGENKISLPEEFLKLKDNEAIITKRLADKLNIKSGDEIEIITGASPINILFPKRFTIVKIVDSKGLLNYRGLDANNGVGTIFITLNAGRTIEKIPKNNYYQILISNKGDYIKGNSLTNKIKTIYNEMNIPGEFIPVKENQIKAVDRGGISYIFLALSLFSMISGGVLIINMYSMLVSERKKELGVLRAIGFKRKDIRNVIFYESIFYTLFSVPFGIGTGVLIARFTFSKVTTLFKSLSSFENIIGEIPLINSFYISSNSILIGIAVGLLLPLSITFWYSYSIGKLNIVNAIKDLEEEKKKNSFEKYKYYIENSFTIIVFIIALLIKIDNFVLLGIKSFLILLSTIMLITFNLKFIEVFLLNIIKLKGKFVPILKIAFSYPMRNRKRTGSIITLYGMVIFIIVILTILPYIHQLQLKSSRDSLFAGFDGVVVEMPTNIFPIKVSKEELKKVDGIKNVGEFYFLVANSKNNEHYGIVFGSKEFFTKNKIKIEKVIDEFKDLSDKEIWLKAFNNPNFAIIPERLTDPKFGYNFELGKTYTAYIPNQTFGPSQSDTIMGTITYKIIAVTSKLSESLAMGPVISINNQNIEKYIKSAIHGYFFSIYPEYKSQIIDYLKKKNQFYIFADDLIDLGLKASQGMISIFNSFLYFGLMIGIIGIAITMMKAVNERRRVIGMLKAIGFTKNMIFLSFFIESTIVILLGILIGLFSGTFTSYLIFLKLFSDSGATFKIPYNNLVLMSLVFYFVSVIFIYLPSKAASKLSPNEAMRSLD
ncbi:putative ABC transport system permease protein [Marinitoga hydrogenitolerans DSM 16785]|uniref:ABC transport system permease protein n=1 Tax=Marinitoga hydrogenitolerans (strain DSM 16785 / JCM 12826 / AT1271) TaxID=1122195 RepID=A0A1M4ZHL9_MARH1|nr:FtsX-like permease family protein [Marinitoga hydrogenitolerans]SHF17540.1 putative ABC transport system permease protein [Marinitoga hydrogenitolerans DSM 16785]